MGPWWVKVVCDHQDIKDSLELQQEGETGFSGETQRGIIWVAVEIDVWEYGRYGQEEEEVGCGESPEAHGVTGGKKKKKK